MQKGTPYWLNYIGTYNGLSFIFASYGRKTQS